MSQPPTLPESAVSELLWRLPRAALIVAENGRIVWANPAASLLTGISRENLFAKTLQSLGYKSASLSTSGGRLTGCIFNAREERSLSIDICLSEINTEGLRLYTLREILEDEAADAARMREQLWQRALESKGLGVWDWSMENNRVFFSDRLIEMLGYQRADFGSDIEAWARLLHPDDKESVWQAIDEYLAGSTDMYVNEHRLLCADGHYKWVQDQGKVIEWNAAGKPTRMVGTHLDISQEMAAKDSLAQRSREMDAFFSLSPDGFLSVREGNVIGTVNQAFCELTDIGTEQWTGQSITAIDQLLKSRCKKPSDFPGLMHLGSLQENADGVRQGVLELREPKSATLRVTSVPDQLEEPGRLFYVRDITHESEVDRMKSEFLAQAAHELRTPIASVFGFSELMLKGNFDEATKTDMTQTIYEQACIVAEILNELLDLARIDARKGKDFIFADFDLQNLVDEVLASFASAPISRRIHVNEPKESIRGYGDKAKLKQCLCNVLNNAGKYSPSDSDIWVDLLSAIKNGQSYSGIRVTDHGIGMTPEQIQHIFDRFYRGEFSQSIPGSGLGMAIVKEIIELHGGRVDVESAVLKGTQVTLWFPAANPETSTAAAD